MNYDLFVLLCVILLVVIVVVVGIILSNKNVNKNPTLDTKHVNEESFQKYAKFYGVYTPTDDRFDIKLYRIYTFIVDKHMTDIKKISELSLCTLPETMMKIRYLKNKRLIGDYYIDTVNCKLLPCTPEDQELLEKYKPFIYGSHLQIDEMIARLPGAYHGNMNELRDNVYNELVYLDKKGLLNGLKIDDIDRRIIYYTIEKRKTHLDMVTVHCPNCGALNDVDIHGKVRCGYCDTIIVGEEKS